MAIWEFFKRGLAATRQGLVRRLAERGGDPVDAVLEEALLEADLGWEATSELVAAVRRAPAEAARETLRRGLLELAGAGAPLAWEGRPSVFVFVGVNGSGKTTTLGKLAWRARRQGRSVLVAASDTFRAAAVEQVRSWAERAGADVVAQAPGADPAAVAFDGLRAAQARRTDVLFVDTAGRLHGRLPLMEELKKVIRVLERELQRPPDEVLLVLDATSGQNAVLQARAFTKAVPVTGLVAAKLDATARGGAVLASRRGLGVPLKLVAVGEGPEDLVDFDPHAFVDGLLEGVAL